MTHVLLLIYRSDHADKSYVLGRLSPTHRPPAFYQMVCLRWGCACPLFVCTFPLCSKKKLSCDIFSGYYHLPKKKKTWIFHVATTNATVKVAKLSLCHLILGSLGGSDGKPRSETNGTKRTERNGRRATDRTERTARNGRNATDGAKRTERNRRSETDGAKRKEQSGQFFQKEAQYTK